MNRLVPASLAVLLAASALAQPAAAQRGVPNDQIRRAERLSSSERRAGARRVHELKHRRSAVTRPDLLGQGTDRPVILLTGYWPPTNEMLRRFSPNPIQNPQGWIGSNWEGSGYDVYAFFPEFPVPTCSSCGQGSGDMEVDYQDTSEDFWTFADGLEPLAVLTFSRGNNDVSWEIEMNQYNRSVWIDDFTPPLQPTPAPPNPAAPAGSLILSTQPVQQIQAAIAAAGLGLAPQICFSGDGGGYLSEFAAYHGAWYQDLHKDPSDPAWCIAGGHVHVGGQIDWATAQLAAEETVRTLIDHVDDVLDPGICQPDLGFAGPGTARLSACGDPLTTGAEFDLVLEDANAFALGWLVAGSNFQPTPFFAGQLVPVPAPILLQLSTNFVGSFGLYNLTLNLPPGAELYAQYVYLDSTAPGLFSLSNAVALQFQ